MKKVDRIAGWLATQAHRDPSVPSLEQAGGPVLCGTTVAQAFPDLLIDPSGYVALEHRVGLSFPLPTCETSTDILISELRLLYGIGTRYSERLREAGYTTIDSLRAHPRWGRTSADLLDRWGSPPNAVEVYRTLSRWFPSSSPLFLALLGLIPPESFLFFDLETLGLSGSAVFLIAVGRLVGKDLVVHQYLAPSLAEEFALLERISNELRTAAVLLSFNGKAFDWIVLKERSAYYGLPLPETPIHVDLLHHARREYGSEVEDCHLSTLETHVLDITREADLPGEQVPFYYTLYLETGNPSPLVPIIHHNRQDVVSLALLLAHLLRRGANA